VAILEPLWGVKGYIYIQVRTNLGMQNVTFSNLNFRSHEITNFNEKPLIYIRKDLY